MDEPGPGRDAIYVRHGRIQVSKVRIVKWETILKSNHEPDEKKKVDEPGPGRVAIYVRQGRIQVS